VEAGSVATLVLVICLGLAPMASAQETDEGDGDKVDRSEEEPSSHYEEFSPDSGDIFWFHPSEWRHFGDAKNKNRYETHWHSQLIYRPMSPWEGMFEGRGVGEVEFGSGHVGSPMRLTGSFAYGLFRHGDIVFETGQGLCEDAGDGRCERRFDQVSADGVYVIMSEPQFEWLARAGVAVSPGAPSVRAGGAAKTLFAPFAVQLDISAQVPVSDFDTVATLISVPAQLQIQVQSHLAMYLTTGFRCVFLSGHRDLTMPVGAGMIFGSRSFDVGLEWRYPRMRGTGRTWDERSLFVTVAIRYL
jgi:hypothetical protein